MSDQARYKVRALSDSTYQELLELVSGKTVVYTPSAERRFFSTGPIPQGLRNEIIRRGGQIVEDYQYALERPAHSL